MKLRILSFSWESFNSDSVISATLMTSLWEITILENHAPLVTSINPSTMYVVHKDKDWKQVREDFAIWRWVVEVSNNDVKVMADMLVDVENLDVETAERARQKAIELMEKYKDAKDRMDMEQYIEAEDMLMKAIAQLKLSDTLK